MNFFVSCYIYPLENKVYLSQELKFHFDNPRSERDIALVKRYWEKAYRMKENNKNFSIADDTFFALEPVLFTFRDKFAPIDGYVAKIFEEYRREDFFEFLARITVLAYFDDEGEVSRISNELKSQKAAGEENIVVVLDNDHPIEANSKKLANYSFLLSLLSHSDGKEYNGLNFIIGSDRIGLEEPPRFLILNYFMFGAFSMSYGEDDNKGEDRLWTFWPYARTKLIQRAALLDKAFKDGLSEKLLYIGNILQIACHTTDVKARIVMLTSIIELLLTHNPPSERFNVDDSINKQFQLKASILVYLNDKRRDINSIKKRLKTIYQQRSNIAHGNFGELDKYIQSLSKKEDDKEYLSDLVTDLYLYVRAILEEFLKDRKFVEFLKAG